MWQGLLEIWFLLLGDVHVTDPRRLFLRKAVGVDTTVMERVSAIALLADETLRGFKASRLD